MPTWVRTQIFWEKGDRNSTCGSDQDTIFDHNRTISYILMFLLCVAWWLYVEEHVSRLGFIRSGGKVNFEKGVYKAGTRGQIPPSALWRSSCCVLSWPLPLLEGVTVRDNVVMYFKSKLIHTQLHLLHWSKDFARKHYRIYSHQGHSIMMVLNFFGVQDQ